MPVANSGKAAGSRTSDGAANDRVNLSGWRNKYPPFGPLWIILPNEMSPGITHR